MKKRLVTMWSASFFVPGFWQEKTHVLFSSMGDQESIVC